MTPLRRLWVLLLLTIAAALVGGACSSDGDDDATTTTAAASATDTITTEVDDGDEVLRVLLVNDDGITHPGLDLMLEALLELPDVEVDVVAPADNQSGTSDQTTEGGAPFGPGTTASGFEGTAVEGFPADAVFVAIDDLGLEPHLVVSGINDAQNIGPFAQISGTVGVARTAIRQGIPGFAVSAGLEFDEDQFAVGAEIVTEWITQNRRALLDRAVVTDWALSVNIPTCPSEQMGELVQVPRAEEFPEGAEPFTSDCDLANTDPVDDVAALRAGYPALTFIPADL